MLKQKRVTDELEDQGIPVRFRPCRLVCRRSARRAAEDRFRAAGASSPHRKRLCGFQGILRRLRAQDLENRLNHPTPAAQFGIVLRGIFSITTSDGETRRLPPGSVFRLEDTSPCKGMIARSVMI